MLYYWGICNELNVRKKCKKIENFDKKVVNLNV